MAIIEAERNFINRSVASITELKTVNVVPRRQGSIIYVAEDPPSPSASPDIKCFLWYPTSTKTPDDEFIVVPDSITPPDPGRWINMFNFFIGDNAIINGDLSINDDLGVANNCRIGLSSLYGKLDINDNTGADKVVFNTETDVYKFFSGLEVRGDDLFLDNFIADAACLVKADFDAWETITSGDGSSTNGKFIALDSSNNSKILLDSNGPSNIDSALTLSQLTTANGIVQTSGTGLLSSSTTLPNGTTATTQSPADNSTKLATTAYVDNANRKAFRRHATAINYNPSVLTDHRIIAVTDTSAARTVVISTEDVQNASPENPRYFTVKDESGGAATNNIIVSLETGNIDGAANFVINAPYNAITLYSDGTNAWIV